MEQVTNAEPSDCAQIWALYEAVKVKGRLDGSSDWDEDYPREEHVKEDLARHWVRVLKADDRILASISIIGEKYPEIESLPWVEGNSCFLTRLCVSPDSQGRGFARLMMRDAASFALNMGFLATHHLAAEVNARANRIYVSMGYDCRGRFRLFDTWYHAYEMLLRQGTPAVTAVPAVPVAPES